jgi:hypothetical protein
MIDALKLDQDNSLRLRAVNKEEVIALLYIIPQQTAINAAHLYLLSLSIFKDKPFSFL